MNPSSVSAMVLAAGLIVPCAHAQVVNVNAALYGYLAPTDPAPIVGQIISPFSLAPGGLPLQLTLPAGSYRLTNATGRPGADPAFGAYRFNSSTWYWGVVIVNHASNAVVLYADAGTVGASMAQVAAQPAVQNVSATFTLPAATTLDFVIRDFLLSDNAGGVSVFIEPFTPACGPADIGRAGGAAGSDGQLDNNDFIVFIDRFFSLDPSADRGAAGGVPGVDGLFDNNDFIVFIDQFFTGC